MRTTGIRTSRDRTSGGPPVFVSTITKPPEVKVNKFFVSVKEMYQLRLTFFGLPCPTLKLPIFGLFWTPYLP